MPLKLIYITNEPEVAKIAQKCGVDRIMVDLEYKGKDIRQAGMNSVKNHHTIYDVRRIRKVLTHSELLVRINPWDSESKKEIDSVIAEKADLIMLPMWKSVNEVKKFVVAVGNRAKKILLLETREAVECIDEVLQLPNIDEIHIGLNDLHLAYKLTFMFELVSNGMVESIINKIKSVGIPYGFGGIAQIGKGDVPAEMVIMEHYRMGSSRVILSRSFCDYTKISDKKELELYFQENMHELCEFEKYAMSASSEDFNNNKHNLQHAVSEVVKKRRLGKCD